MAPGVTPTTTTPQADRSESRSTVDSQSMTPAVELPAVHHHRHRDSSIQRSGVVSRPPSASRSSGLSHGSGTTDDRDISRARSASGRDHAPAAASASARRRTTLPFGSPGLDPVAEVVEAGQPSLDDVDDQRPRLIGRHPGRTVDDRSRQARVAECSAGHELVRPRRACAGSTATRRPSGGQGRLPARAPEPAASAPTPGAAPRHWVRRARTAVRRRAEQRCSAAGHWAMPSRGGPRRATPNATSDRGATGPAQGRPRAGSAVVW